MTDKAFKIRLEVRDRIYEFGADTAQESLIQFIKELFNMDINAVNNGDEAVQRLLDQYRQRFGRGRMRTPIFRGGVEIDLARCYLTKMTTFETVDWLKKERNFKTNKSAVGRYFARFGRLAAGVR